MTNQQLLDAIGEARGRYVRKAQTHRDGTAKPGRAVYPWRKVWLIAAILALMLVLVGCVAYVLSLNDLILGKEDWEDSRTGNVETRTIVSLQGLLGSPGYQASREWFDWIHVYDPDMEILMSEETDFSDYGEAYQAYGLYTPEMKEKLDEICQKYGLELLGKPHVNTDIRDTFRELGIRGIFREDAPVLVESGDHYYFENGSFDIQWRITLTGADPVWPDPLEIQFHCAQKDAFANTQMVIGPVETYDQWTYTTRDGVDVLLAMDDSTALMLVDKDDYFLSVTGIGIRGGNLLTGRTVMDRQTLEALAELFDFTIQPGRVSRETAQYGDQAYEEAFRRQLEEHQKEMEQYTLDFGQESFEARVKYHLQASTAPGRLGYALKDLDGDGRAELLIGLDGWILYCYGEKDGQTTDILGILGERYFLSDQGNLVTAGYQNEDDPYATRTFYKVVNSERTTVKHIVRNEDWLRDGESAFRAAYNGAERTSPITEEEFREVWHSEQRVVLDMLPLTQYPMKTEQVDWSQVGWDDRHYWGWESYEDIILHYLLNPEELDNGEFKEYRYALIDLDGDGQEEFYWDEDTFRGIYALREGKLVLPFNDEEFYICENNVIEVVRTYSETSKVHCFYRLEGGCVKEEAYLRYDADRSPENPWLQSTDASGQDMSLRPISQEEFYDILAQYRHIEPDMKPITEYPLSRP